MELTEQLMVEFGMPVVPDRDVAAALLARLAETPSPD
jgi:hypothetical protein